MKATTVNNYENFNMEAIIELIKKIELKDILHSIPVIITGILWIWRKYVFNLLKAIKSYILAPIMVQKSIEILQKELTPNGGGSMKDHLSYVRKMIDDINKRSVLSEARVRVLMSQISNPIWESDSNGNCVWANDAMLQLLQRDFSEVEGDSWKSIIYEKDSEKVIDEWETCVKQHRPFRLTYHWVKRDGTLVEIKAESRLLKDSKQLLYGYIGIVNILKDNIKYFDIKEIS